jgi:sec-independent protein translocase protein TatA
LKIPLQADTIVLVQAPPATDWIRHPILDQDWNRRKKDSFMFDLMANFTSWQGWIIVLIIVLILFGGQRIPEIMKGFGSGLKEFKKGLREEDEDLKPSQKTEEKETAKKE